MSIVVSIILTVQMLAALAMIGLILVQHGKGADMGAAFGSGASGSLFGASGSANFLVCTLALAYFGNLRTGSAAPTGSVLDSAASQPAAPAATPAAQPETGNQIPAK